MSYLQRQIDLMKTEFAYRYFRKRAYDKRKSDVLLDSEFSDAFYELKKNGIAVVEDYYTSEMCDELCNEIDSLIVKFQDKIWVDSKSSDHRIFGAEMYSTLVRKFATDEHILKLGEKYLETELKLTMTLAARLDYVSGNLGSGGGWHRDSVIFNEFKSILYLSDVEKFNGPFTYMLGSHMQNELIHTIRKGNAQYDQYRFTDEQVYSIGLESGQKSKQFTAKKGSLILVDTRGLHIGAPIQSGSRYALTNYFSPSFRYEKMMKHCNKVILKAD